MPNMTQTEIAVPQVETIPTSQLKTDLKNPNKMSRDQLDRLKASIKKFGFIVPIITNKDLLIADGEQRWIVANELAMPNVSVIRLPVEEVDRHLIRQVMNKLRGEHELLLDAEEFEAIIDLGKKDDLKYLLDLSDGKLERYLMELHPPKEETFEIPEIDKVQTEIKIGDTISLGAHKLRCGDSTNTTDIESLLENVNPIMVFTDPPYGVTFDKHGGNEAAFLKKATKNIEKPGFKNYGILEGDRTTETYLKFIKAITPKLSKISWYLCTSDRGLSDVLNCLGELKIHYSTTIIWVKEHWVPSWERYHAQHEHIIFAGDGSTPTGNKSIWYGANNESSVWQIHRDNDVEVKHPTKKPVALIIRAITNSSKPQDSVVDFFGGSGSTLIACEQTGRVCYMMEIDPRYCEVIAQRWERYTGQKRKKVKENASQQQPQTN